MPTAQYTREHTGVIMGAHVYISYPNRPRMNGANEDNATLPRQCACMLFAALPTCRHELVRANIRFYPRTGDTKRDGTIRNESTSTRTPYECIRRIPGTVSQTKLLVEAGGNWNVQRECTVLDNGQSYWMHSKINRPYIASPISLL